MAIIGNLWDRTLSTRAGDALSGVTLTTLAHSLPATNPHIFIVAMRSIEGVGVNSALVMFGLRGNASLNTVGFRTSSAASAPTVEYEGIAAVLHSIIA